MVGGGQDDLKMCDGDGKMRARLVQGFLRGLDGKTKGTKVLCPCPGVDLAWFPFLGTWFFLPKRLELSYPRPLCAHWGLEIPCVPSEEC